MELTVQGFRAWLLEQDEDGWVGMACTPYHCPIAEYVREKTGKAYVHVSPDLWRAGATMGPVPAWAQQFISRVDSLSGEGWYEDFLSSEAEEIDITAAEALGLLDSIPGA